MEKKAILAGASGAIGSSLLQQLLSNTSYKEVLVLVRKELDVKNPKLKQIVLDFDKLDDYASQITGDVVFCCLGTTKSETPNKDLYRKIDYQYPLDIAWLAQANGAKSYHLVSAMGANIDSSMFYNRTKGITEQDLKTVPFENICIYQPSLLNGNRSKKRLAEGILNVIMLVVNPFLFGPMRKYRSIKVENVAKAMVINSLQDHKGVFTYESDQIQEISNHKLPI